MKIGDLPPWEMTTRFQRVRPLKGEVPPPPPLYPRPNKEIREANRARAAHLRAERAKQIAQEKQAPYVPPVDLTGRTYGRVTVLGFHGKRIGSKYWKCRCNCGRVFIVQQQALLHNRTHSCGLTGCKRISQKQTRDAEQRNGQA